MWSAVLLFGVIVNFEPNRLGLIALMLTKKQPIHQLATFLTTSFLMSSTVGLLVLFVFHQGLFGAGRLNGPLIQLCIGFLVLALAAVVALKPSWLPNVRRAPNPADDTADEQADSPRRIDVLATRARDVVTSESRWFSMLAGAGIALPTIEYMALLALIVGSNTTPLTQAAALFTFLMLGNVVGLVPIIGYGISPDKTSAKVQAFNGWVRSRRRRDVVIVLAIIGTILVATGGSRLEL